MPGFKKECKEACTSRPSPRGGRSHEALHAKSAHQRLSEINCVRCFTETQLMTHAAKTSFHHLTASDCTIQTWSERSVNLILYTVLIQIHHAGSSLGLSNYSGQRKAGGSAHWNGTPRTSTRVQVEALARTSKHCRHCICGHADRAVLLQFKSE